MFVQTNENRYHVAFELDRRRPRARAVTRCKIFLLTDASGPTLVSQGETLQGKEDEFNAVTGCRFALKRALANYGFQKSTRTLFWKEFNRRFRRDVVTCREAFAGVGGTFSGTRLMDFDKRFGKEFEDEARRVHGYGGLYSFQERAMKKMIAMSNPTGRGAKDFYARSRHEYADGGTVGKFCGPSPSTL